MKKELWVSCILIIGCVLPLVGQSPDNQNVKPNVILIVTDDQGYGDLACHGNPWLNTPNMDRLYKESTRFTNFHVSPTCSPTRAALMTGHYTNRTGAWHTIGGRSLLRENEMTMADVFAANGYATAIFGKWHLGDNYPFRPQDRGFQEVLIHGGGGVGQQPDYWDNDYFDDTYFHNGKPEKYTGYCTDVWFDEAIRYIDKKQGEEQPFFCYLATNAPHGPYYVENSYLKEYENNDSIPNPAFYGMVENLDENLGRLLSYLKRNNMEENTILVFMTDNGTAGGVNFKKGTGYNAGMRGAKGSMYEGGHRVPLFIRWPKGNISQGTEIATLTAHIDLLPTFIDLLTLKTPSKVDFDGTSLLPLLKGEISSDLQNRILITDSQRLEMPKKWRQSSVMQEGWRLINGKELYDISKDPGQNNDIAGKHPDKVKNLQNAYENWWKDISPSFENTPAIVICPNQEPITMLYNHDMHFEDETEKIAWHQEYVREGVKNKGWFAVKVPKQGKYRITLLRWPESVKSAIGEGVPSRPALSGTTVGEFPAGKTLDIQKAGISFNGKKQEKAINPGDKGVSFDQTLDTGDYKFKAWFKDSKGEEFSAFYIKIEKLK